MIESKIEQEWKNSGAGEGGDNDHDYYEDAESFSSFSDDQQSPPYYHYSSPSSFPQFPIDPDKVTVLYSPTEFHQCLVDLYRSAERRIVLAALYIGTAAPEGQVIDAVAESCRRALLFPTKTACSSDGICRSNSESSGQRSAASTRSSSEIATSTIGSSSSTAALQEESQLVVDILIDSARGRRLEGGGSSLTMLESMFDLKEIAQQQNSQNSSLRKGLGPPFQSSHLPSDFSSSTSSPLSININLFHSPLLSGLLYRVLPPRVNEVLGVFHTKVFLVDNTVILTGANLSGSYLTNRQDRYVVIKDAALLADFLHRLIRLIQKFSFSVELEEPSTPTQQQTQEEEAGGRWWSGRRPHRDDYVVTLNNGKNVTLNLEQGIPDPMISSEEFKIKFGQALSEFLLQHSPPAPQTSLSSTTLHVAIQAGFCHPPVQQEQELLSILLSSPDDSSRVPLWSDQLRDFVRRPSSSSPYPYPSQKSASAESPLLERLDTDSTTSASPRPTATSGITPLGNSLGRIILASGYLNMADELLEQLTKATGQQSNTNESSLEVFMAAPEANSFHQSQGLSKYIPMAYSYVGATQLLRLRELWEQRRRENAVAVRRYQWEPSGAFTRWLLGYGPLEQDSQRGRPPIFWEYDRASWTFHSKGVWFYPRHRNVIGESDQPTSHHHQTVEEYPTATIVGSSNFGLRSRIRDLDISFLIQTKDIRLQQQFHKEIEVMRHHSREVADVSMLVTRCPRWLRFLLRCAGLKTLL